MSEVLTEEVQQQPTFNPFAEESWTNAPVETTVQSQDATQAQETQTAETQEQQSEQKNDTPQVDYNAYVKEKFGFDNEETALQEIAKLKQQKDALKFENETSEKFFTLLKEGKEDELFNFLAEKKRLDKLATASVDNVDVAADILKLNFQKKYKDLSADEVEYLFNKQFSIPSKPTQKDDELDIEYEERLATWEREKALAEKQIIIEAKLAKPEIEKYKADLKLPDISNLTKANEPTEEDLKLEQEARDSYLAKLNSDYKAFEGFNVAVKNEDVDIAVAFTPTEDEKVALKEMLSDFDYENFLSARWIKDGVPDVKQAMEDIYLLQNGKKVMQKMANEAANKMFEEIVKKNSNIKLGKSSQPSFTPDNTNERDKLAAFFLSQK